MLYSYEAKDPQGRTVTGSIEAADERSAAKQVHDIGYFVMRLYPIPGQAPAPPAPAPALPPSAAYPMAPPAAAAYTGPPRAVAYAPPPAMTAPISTQPVYPNGYAPPIDAETPAWMDRRPMTVGRWLMEKIVYQVWSGVGTRDLAMFYRQFATLIDAGVSMRQTFETLTVQSPNGALSRALRQVWQVIEAGATLSQGMSLFPWIFRDNQRALIMAGELSGTVDLMCRRISDFLESEYTFRRNLIKEATMPLVTLCGVFLLPPLFLVVVLGQWMAYYHAAVEPLLMTVLTIFLIYLAGKLMSQIKVATDFVLVKFPGLGGALKLVALARFARTLSTLYSAGISIPSAVYYSAIACGNAWMAQRMSSAIPMMEAGYGIVDSLVQTRIFPPIVVSMLGVGETTGSIDTMMDKIATHFEQEALLKLHQITVAVGVLAIIIIGIKVLFVLIQFYSGYFGSMLKDTDPGMLLLSLRTVLGLC